MRAEARLAQREYDDSELAGVNPNSLHSLGRKAAARLEAARREIARSFGARVRPSEIVLTNGGTEANHSVSELARSLGVDIPLTFAVEQTLYNGVTLDRALEILTDRVPSQEFYGLTD